MCICTSRKEREREKETYIYIYVHIHATPPPRTNLKQAFWLVSNSSRALYPRNPHIPKKFQNSKKSKDTIPNLKTTGHRLDFFVFLGDFLECFEFVDFFKEFLDSSEFWEFLDFVCNFSICFGFF